jgi:hypothetical protein
MTEIQEFLHSIASVESMSEEEILEELAQIDVLLEESTNESDSISLQLREASLENQLRLVRM